MARLSMGQKANRVLKLLLGVRNPRVLMPLTSRGFKQADLDEGWRLLRSTVKVTFDTPPSNDGDPALILKLDKWENDWFPTASAALRRHFPKVYERVFNNLSQTEGPAVIMSVGTLVERITELQKGDEQSQKAAQLLVDRGMTSAVMAEAQSLLEQLGLPAADVTVPNLDTIRKDTAAAEAELWSWYLEWGQIARNVITDRRLLRELGFLRVVQRGGVEVEEDEVDPETEQDGEAAAKPAVEIAAVKPAMPIKADANDPNTKVGMPGSNPFTEA